MDRESGGTWLKLKYQMAAWIGVYKKVATATATAPHSASLQITDGEARASVKKCREIAVEGLVDGVWVVFGTLDGSSCRGKMTARF